MKLSAGDIVKRSWNGAYIKYVVRRVRGSTVEASIPGFGSCRFEWDDKTRIGLDNVHGIKYYFVRHGVPDGWFDIKTAPATEWVEVLMSDGQTHQAHYAEDTTGGCQPSFRRWFKLFYHDEHIAIETPRAWRPIPESPL